MQNIKEILKHILPGFLINHLKRITASRKLTKGLKEWEKKWKNDGLPLPVPHYVKRLTIEEYQKRYGYPVFIETGTYLGEMVEAQKNNFDSIISIELGQELYENCRQKFINNEKVKLFLGDSGMILRTILPGIIKPAIFWLDAHYSGGITVRGNKKCPIFEELDAIFNNNKLDHIILIDDARCFTGENDYPTIKDLSEYVFDKNSKYKFEVRNDIIRVVPNRLKH